MTSLYFCKNCPLTKKDCGPFAEDSEIFRNCKQIHKPHPGWQRYSETIDSFQEGIDFVIEQFTKAKEKTTKRQKEKGRPLIQIEQYLKSKIKNDSKLVRKITWCCFSAYTSNPINLGIMAPTSEGKTYATVKVSEIFPKDDVISVGRMSPTALIHQNGIRVDENLNPIDSKIESLEYEIANTEDKETRTQAKKEIEELLKTAKNLIDLKGKILLFLDAPDIKLWDVLKPILSHDMEQITFKTTQTDGSLKVKESIIQGWPAVIFCSAKNEAKDRIWDEIETRFDITSPNTSVKKYKAANTYTALKMGTPSFASSLVGDDEDEKYAKFHVGKIKEQLCKLNKDNPVWSPFNKIIAESFPTRDGSSMRHFNRFTAYCNLSTMINASQKYKIIFQTKDGKKEIYLISDLSDIDTAIEMIGDLSAIPPTLVNFVNDIFIPATTAVDTEGVTTQQLAEKYIVVYKKDITAKKILESFIKPLNNYGIVDFKENVDDKRQHLNFLSSNKTGNSLEIVRNKIIEESNNNDLFVWHYILELEKCSIKTGKIKVILDPQGHAEGHNLIQKNIIKTQTESNTLEVLCT